MTRTVKDVSNVTTMGLMFQDATSFNQPLNNWNVSNVKTMVQMFDGATFFNQPLNNWNVSNVTNMEWMFSDASCFNQPLNKWNVSNVWRMDSMFSGARSFNQAKFIVGLCGARRVPRLYQEFGPSRSTAVHTGAARLADTSKRQEKTAASR